MGAVKKEKKNPTWKFFFRYEEDGRRKCPHASDRPLRINPLPSAVLLPYYCAGRVTYNDHFTADVLDQSTLSDSRRTCFLLSLHRNEHDYDINLNSSEVNSKLSLCWKYRICCQGFGKVEESGWQKIYWRILRCLR